MVNNLYSCNIKSNRHHTVYVLPSVCAVCTEAHALESILNALCVPDTTDAYLTLQEFKSLAIRHNTQCSPDKFYPPPKNREK